MSNDIDKCKAALAALIAAREACAEAGIAVRADQVHGSELALDALVRDTEQRITSMARRALPIAFGDTILIHDVNAKAPRREAVTKVGRTRIHTGEGRDVRQYLLDGGGMVDFWQRKIDPDDLYRIRRDLAGKRAPKPAPVPQEIAVAVVASKGGA